MKIKDPFKYTVCCICGKNFIKSVSSIYNVEFAGRINHCCSYTCYQEAKKFKSTLNQPAYKHYLEESRNNLNEVNNNV